MPAVAAGATRKLVRFLAGNDMLDHRGDTKNRAQRISQMYECMSGYC
ncbi:hypothetical protein ACVWW6_008772 [Bradyrhizobium sp. USDA 3311]